MNQKLNSNIFTATSSLKILSFLVDNPGREFLGSEIQKAISISRAGVYLALRELIKEKLVIKTLKGKFLLYSIAYENPVVKQFKVLKNILFLQSIVSKLKSSAKKIILYGSASRGEDSPDSDIDLFVLSKEPPETKGILSSLKLKRKIQAVVKSPSEWAEFKDKEKVFYEEVNRGITLFEEKE